MINIPKKRSNQTILSYNKWVKYKALKSIKKLGPYLPATQTFSKQALWSFIEKYGTVMLKPCLGKSGYGIMQVSELKENQYLIQNENRKFIMSGKKPTFKQLKSMTQAQNYMIQQRIPLAEIQTRPMDIRVMVQRKKQLPWEITGMLAKVAEHGYVVTNVSRTILPIKKAIKLSSIQSFSTPKTVKMINTVCLLAAEELGQFYPSRNMIGFDIGLDHNARVWIIEANFTPSMHPFSLLKDKSMYHKIKSFRENSAP